ncbi:hypothetical protein AAG570_010737 [Ranatra chinensis]|uniref:Cytosol aminopeptidase n=1 Tax=Ranatra chinensis TaxID=642074 RepID=A0ABD0YND3_9HEMI
MKYNQYTCGHLVEHLKASGPIPKLGEARLFFNVEPTFPVVAVVGLGHECYGYNKNEERDEAKEAIRVGVGAGCRALQQLNISKLYVENFGHAESAAEGAALALWVYQDLKNPSKKTRVPHLGLYDDCDWEWAKENNMNAFLAVSKGSFEPPLFLEISYSGCDPCIDPIVLVGKGITFDSGGICLKKHEDMEHMRGDMAGAACVVSTVRAIASLRLPVNVRGLIPLCENMPGASATKPGDIVRAMNGKSILIANTDYEGQLVLADALCYALKYKPKVIVDVGTLTKEMKGVIGPAATGAFTNNDNLWASIKAASIHTEHVSCDLANLAEGFGGHSCTTAAFLREFICDFNWLHLDSYGVMVESGDTTYLRKGMSGRPTRTLIEFIAQFACKPPEKKCE